MAITKPPVLPAWAESGDKVTPSNAEIQVGWPLSSIPPSRQRFNWLLNFLANGIRYFSRRGLPDYDAAETYMTGDRIIGDDGKTYRSLIDNNTAQTPSTSPTKWEEWAPTLSRFAALIQGQTYTAFTTAGAAPNFTLTPSPAIAAYAAGQRFRVKFHAAGTGADALNISTLGNKNLKQYDSTGSKIAPVIAANQLADIEYDGVDLVILDPLPASGALPLAALPFPTIGATNRVMGATGAIVAGQGGTVSVPAGVAVSLSEEVSVGVTGVLRSFITSAWTSANLAVSSTYYLRAQVQSGALTFYVQQGTDADSIPASLKGTPGAASLGGFDSTVLDMLVAKVVTGVAGSTPTVTNLANAPLLFSKTVAGDNYTRTTGGSGAMAAKRNTPLTLNWARVPSRYAVRTAYGITGAAGSPEEFNVAYTGTMTDGSGTLTATFSRYTFDPVFGGDWNTASTSFSFSFQTDYTVEA